MLDLEEANHVRSLRNKALYEGYSNSLIEWLNSSEWSEVGGSATVRGMCVKAVDTVQADEVQGEITWR